MSSGFLGEFMGTAVMVLLGNGTVANITLKKSKAEGAGWVAVTAGWAMAVMAGVFTAMGCGSYGHLNPAVTLAVAVRTGDVSKLGTYVLAQTLGAMVGALLVWLYFYPHWRETADPAAKLGCFGTIPAIRNAASNLFSEIVGSFVLVLVVAAIFSKAVSPTGPGGLGPYLVGSLVWGIGLGLGGTTGYAINPARDFGPRLMHAILPIAGKGGSDWSYAPVPVIGPLVGGALAGLVVRCVGMA